MPVRIARSGWRFRPTLKTASEAKKYQSAHINAMCAGPGTSQKRNITIPENDS